jgi:hypothetical protein
VSALVQQLLNVDLEEKPEDRAELLGIVEEARRHFLE